ncbi:unnamed protein product [Amoebophrya sp. A120]|nr:unnamed protein product [Amoebophrya sp. A120]|eukprot:GSA120T00008439001.1
MATTQQARRLVAGDGPQIASSKLFPDPKEFKCGQNAEYLKKRLQVWEKVKAKHEQAIAKIPKKEITITLPDGKLVKGTSFETTPESIAVGISKKLAEKIVVAKVYYSETIASLSQVVNADEEPESDEDGSDDEEDAKDEKFVLWDISRPLEGNCTLHLLTFDDKLASDVFWHSSAHVLGQSIEVEFGAHLTIGPSLEKGFYYDGFFGDKKISTTDDLPKLEKRCQEIVKENQPFERVTLTKEDALEMFADNPFKVQLITNKVPDGSMTSCYRCGPLVDLCRGPHLPSTGKCKSFWIHKNSASYWLGKDKNDSLQRIYGVSYPSDKELKQHKTQLEEAAKRDHREIGKKQELYFFSDFSAGSCFWMPHGARIYNKLVEFMRREYAIRGFQEVITPNLYHESLFKASGHYYKYKDDMYNMDIEGERWFLKPMNCPGHCVVFAHRVRSYRELPLRMASFGVLHRNENSGALSGLTRVRRFQQDDGHIFCRMDQVKSEIKNALKFVQFIYETIGLEYTMVLSTRPKKAIGSKEVWANAEKQLAEALNESGLPWGLNKGDGAFYGPKIDFKVKDAIGRQHQCATMQLDFLFPMRFNLQFRTQADEQKEAEAAKAEGEQAQAAGAAPKETKENKKDKKAAAAAAEPKEPRASATSADGGAPAADAGKSAADKEKEKEQRMEAVGLEGVLKPGHERPVMIHRAILGSVERFTGILCEHYGGKWPFFISPRQVMIVPTHAGLNKYCEYVAEQYKNFGIFADVDTSSKTMNKKVREAQLAQYNYVAICGEKEQSALAVNLRDRDTGKPLGEFSIKDSVEMFVAKSNPNSKPANQFDEFEGQKPEPIGAGKNGASSSSSAASSASKPEKLSAETAGASSKNDSTTSKETTAAAGGAKNKKQEHQNNGENNKNGAIKKDWESHFAQFPYAGGFEMSATDKKLFEECKGGMPSSENFQRWFQHVGSLVRSGIV